jgi:hypothetical protein
VSGPAAASHLPVQPVGADELLMGAALGNLAVVRTTISSICSSPSAHG